MTKKNTEYYVNNKDFLEAITVFKNKVREAEEQGKTRPRIPHYIGDCFLKIATHLSYKPNFVNYTFREDMISDGVENCVQYINNFDPEKSTPLLTSLKSSTTPFFVGSKKRNVRMTSNKKSWRRLVLIM